MKTNLSSWIGSPAVLLLCVSAVLAQDGSPAKPESEAVARSVREALNQRLSVFDWPLAETAKTAAEAKPQAKLTLDEVLSTVELYHPKLLGAERQRRIASAKRLEKQGAFDPVFTTGADYLRFNTDFDSKTLRGKPATMRLADAGVEVLTRSGIKIGGGTRFNLGKVKAPLSPTGSGGEYFMEFKMPLLRGWRINEKSAAERQALLGEPLADTEFQTTRLDLLLKAATTYWEWVAAKQKLDVARNLLSLAEFRSRAVRDRVAAGDLPQIDAVEADLEVQRRQGGVVKADRDLQKAAFKLSLFLWQPNGLPAPLLSEAAAPAGTPSPVVFDTDRAQAGQRLAIERRPELKAVALNRDITQVDLDLAKNQRLPAIDLAFSPGRDAGLGSIGNTVKAGVSFTLPLRQRTADGRISAANLKIQKLDLDLLNERQRISTEVLDAVSAINTTYDRYRAAQTEVELAVRLEEGEREKFRLGDSTLFLVNQRERATAEARVKLIEIQAEYEQAVAAFRAATVQF
ncbi:MAG TPA: TolC family protein [Blastocatellia bacterium]|nr:TolC family protein [Blastocatellia bacterium]HMZ18427.1 TolC family protein [Blastocatellia bacterium]HNG32648.1 TolC family protein [Blastocatellia bacterium]